MRAQEFVTEALHFVRPGELRGSYSDREMLAMGFRQAQNGAWYIDQRRWDQLVQSGQLKENWGPEQYPGILPIGDYLSPESEFVDPTGKQDPTYLLQDVDDLINAGVEPEITTISPSTVYATQDWLSNDGGDGPLYPEYEDLPVVYIKNRKPYVLDGHHRITAALKQRKPIKVYLFTDQASTQLQEFAPDSAGGAQSYYTSTENFVNDYRERKKEEIEEMTSDGWSQSEINELRQAVNNDIYRFQQVQRGFLKGLKPGFDAYLQMDTQLKDSLGCHWIGDNLDLNSDWATIYGEPWGNDEAC
jgi:hypothetical protein